MVLCSVYIVNSVKKNNFMSIWYSNTYKKGDIVSIAWLVGSEKVRGKG